jgi:uncharacterized membrane protein YuzA (DUF378 family)
MILLIIGGLNWGLVGFFGFDLVTAIFGADSNASLFVYDLVGLSALYKIFSMYKGHCPVCK